MHGGVNYSRMAEKAETDIWKIGFKIIQSELDTYGGLQTVQHSVRDGDLQ